MEQWNDLQKDLRNIFESFMIRCDKMLDVMFERQDYVIAGKQELEKMTGSDSKAQKTNSNLVLEEIKDLVDEVGVVAQAQVDTEPESQSKQESET